MMQRIISIAKNDDVSTTVKVPNLKAKTVAQAESQTKQLGLNLVKIGSGDRISNQGVKSGEKLESGSKIFVNTSGKIICPDMTGWTYSDLHQFASLTDIKLSIKGTGTVASQSVAKGTELKAGRKLNIKLKE